jgi:hypothetical protein
VYLATVKICQMADVSVCSAYYPEYSESKFAGLELEYVCTRSEKKLRKVIG